MFVPAESLAMRTRLTIAALVLGAAAAALAVYALPGDSGALDDARADLAHQVPAAGTVSGKTRQEHIHAELERHLLQKPSDARAQVLEARLDMQSGRFAPAAAAYQKALESSTKVARDPRVWVEYAEARGMLQGGTLAGQPLLLVEKALQLDARNPQALDLAGSAAWERRDFPAAARHWKRLLEQIPADTPRHAELSAAIDRAELRARLSLPAPR